MYKDDSSSFNSYESKKLRADKLLTLDREKVLCTQKTEGSLG